MDSVCQDTQGLGQSSKHPFEHDADMSPRRLACPFAKRWPWKYDSRRACSGPGWHTVTKVKEHIYRAHMRPLQCRRCGGGFETKEGLNDHMLAPRACETRPHVALDGITSEQREELRSRKNSKQFASEEERWFAVFRLLFSDVKEVPSPCE